MKLQTERGNILLPSDFSFEITSNHPFFSDEGTASVPATLPPSAANLHVLDHPEDSFRRTRLLRKFPAVLSHGTFSKRCQMVISGASRKEGLSCSLALQESELYAACQEKNLRDIFAGIAYSWANYLSNGRKSTGTSFVVLPVAADQDNGTPQTILNSESNGSLVFSSRTITFGGEQVTVPIGYGVAPFAYLHFVISRMFTALGYTVDSNVFATDSRLSDIALLHNCADTLVHYETSWSILQNAQFYLADIVPNITVGDFITWLRDKFGAFVTVKDKNVTIRLFQDVAAGSADADLTGYLRSEETLSYPEPKMLDYGNDNSIFSAEAVESLEALRESYPTMAALTNYSDIAGTGLFYVKPRGKYYYKNTAAGEVKLISSDNYHFTRKTEDMDTEAIGPADLFAPMVQVGSVYMPYVGDSIRRFTDLDNKDPEADIPIMITRVYRNASGAAYGSNYPCAETGADLSTGAKHSLNSETLASIYWPLYRDLLVNGAPEISCTLAIPMSVLSSMELWTPKILANKKVLIKSLKYSISANGISGCEAVLQLLPEYEDAVAFPAIEFNSSFGWLRASTLNVNTYGNTSNGRLITDTDGLTDYTSNDAPKYTPKVLGEKARVRDRYVIVTEYYSKWFPRWFTIYESGSHSYRVNYQEYFISALSE